MWVHAPSPCTWKKLCTSKFMHTNFHTPTFAPQNVHTLNPLWCGPMFTFSLVWIWPDWKVGWEITLMDEMLHIKWLAKSAKSGDNWWSWKFEEIVIIHLLFLYCFVVWRLWILVCCSSCFNDAQIKFWWWNMVFLVVWWRCINVVAREMGRSIGGKDKWEATNEAKCHYTNDF